MYLLILCRSTNQCIRSILDVAALVEGIVYEYYAICAIE